MFHKKNQNNKRILIFVSLTALILVSVFFIFCWGQREDLLIKKNTPSYHIVVAKYKEDITWFSHMDRDKLYVYDKSGDKQSPFIPLENKGREGSTFLGHIIEYYDSLPDYVILVQGNPFAHMRPEITPQNFQSNINKLIEKRPAKKQPLFCDYWKEHSNTYSGLMIDQYIEYIFEGKPKGTIQYASGNQYIIPRKEILKRPKAFYQKLWKMTIKGDHYSNHQAHFAQKNFDRSEIIGWTFERLFDMIISDVPVNKKFLSS